MIFLAIRNAFVMLIMILIVHFLLKHILYDMSLNNPYFFIKQDKSSAPIPNEKTEIVSEPNQSEPKQSRQFNEKNLEDEKKSGLEAFLNEKEGIETSSLLNDNVKMQPRHPFSREDTKIEPKQKDVFAFILEGDKNIENSELLNQKENPKGTFFKKAHIPQEAIEDPKKIKKDGIEMNITTQDMNPYNSSLYKMNKGSKFLFQNVEASNEDEGCVGIDEIFKQTQIKN